MNKLFASRLDGFIDYCLMFYGKGKIYDIGATYDELKHATRQYLNADTGISFEADSIDRENVRDIVIRNRKESMTGYYLFKATYQMMAHDLCLKGEQ